MGPWSKRFTAAICCAALAWSAFSFAQAPQPKPSTQKATVSPEAFPTTHPLMQDPKSAKTFTATGITYKTQQPTPALQALQELAKQTGYTIKPYDTRQAIRGQNVSIEAVNQPFWLVLREICVKGNLGLYNSGGDDTRSITIVPPNWGSGIRAAASIKGPFLNVLSDLQRINTVNMSKPNEVERHIQIQLNTFVEPKVRVTQMSYQPVVDEAVDENGNSMTPTDERDERNSMQSSRGVSWYGSFQLPYPTTNPGHKITRIAGHIGATVQLHSQPIEVADPLNAPVTKKTVGSRRVEFNSLKKQNEQYMLELVFYRDGQDPNRMNDVFNESIDLKLTDAKGREYRSYQSGGNGDGEKVTRRFTFQKRSRDATDAPGDPVKLVIEIPTATQEISIPFELVDLPMP